MAELQMGVKFCSALTTLWTNFCEGCFHHHHLSSVDFWRQDQQLALVIVAQLFHTISTAISYGPLNSEQSLLNSVVYGGGHQNHCFHIWAFAATTLPPSIWEASNHCLWITGLLEPMELYQLCTHPLLLPAKLFLVLPQPGLK